MAEDLTVRTPAAATRAPRERRRRPHLRRFAIAYAALALITAAAALGLLYVWQLERPQARAWSQWQPTQEGEARLWEISAFVMGRYANNSTTLPLQALPGPPGVRLRAAGSVERVPLDGVVVSAGPTAGAAALDNSVMYVLCGRGNACAMHRDDVTSEEFGVVLQRAALELALYTFKYIEEIESVLFFLPPVDAGVDAQGQPQRLETAVFVKREDVSVNLDNPLAETLPGDVHDTRGAAARNVLRIVLPRLYTFTVENTTQGGTLLMLTPYRG
jgi:hypothetical protein